MCYAIGAIKERTTRGHACRIGDTVWYASSWAVSSTIGDICLYFHHHGPLTRVPFFGLW